MRFSRSKSCGVLAILVTTASSYGEQNGLTVLNEATTLGSHPQGFECAATRLVRRQDSKNAVVHDSAGSNGKSRTLPGRTTAMSPGLFRRAMGHKRFAFVREIFSMPSWNVKPR